MILKTDVPTLGADDSTIYQAYLLTRGVAPSGQVSRLSHLREGVLVARQRSGASVRCSIIGEFGGRTPATGDVSLTPEGTETHVIKDVEGMQDADLTYAQMKMGDSAAVDSRWSLDMLLVNVKGDGEA